MKLRRWTILFLVLLLCSSGGILAMKLHISNPDPANPYRQGIPVHEMDLEYFRTYWPEMISGMPSFIYIPEQDLCYYAAPEEGAEVLCRLEAGKGYEDEYSLWLSGFQTFPTYKPGWRCAPSVLEDEEELRRARWSGKVAEYRESLPEGPFYVKKRELTALSEQYLKAHLKGRGLFDPVGWRLRWMLVRARLEPGIADRMLYENGLYLSPDLPAYVLCRWLVYLSAVGLGACGAVALLQRWRQRRGKWR